MAEEKTMSKEERKKKEEKERALNVGKTLESKFLQNSVGTNLVRSNPYVYAGQKGYNSALSLYDQTMAGDDAKKVKDDIYNKKLAAGKKLGVADEPPTTSNYEVSVYAMQQINEILMMARIGELEKAVTGLGVKLSFQVGPLSNYLVSDLIAKGMNEEGEFDEDRLDEKEKDAYDMFKILSEEYKSYCALNASKANYCAELDAKAKKITDKYKPKESKK